MSARTPLLAVCLMLGCSGGAEAEHVTAQERGRELFHDGSTSATKASCASCHPLGSEADRIYPGADLRGVSSRSSFWGGQENDLLQAVNACRTLFQGLSALEPSTREAADLYAFLESLTGSPDPVPFTVVNSVLDLDPGDAERGRSTYAAACQPCHGEANAGAGHLSAVIPVLPDDALAKHLSYSALEQRLVFVEKARHGRFFGYGGFMPPFSLEALPDRELADLLSALELYPP
jgi:thiosulfate dehydrogenase